MVVRREAKRLGVRQRLSVARRPPPPILKCSPSGTYRSNVSPMNITCESRGGCLHLQRHRREPQFDLEERSGPSGLHELDIERDGDLVTNQNAAGLERSVPRQAEVLAIDRGDRGDWDPGITPWILRRWSWPFHRKAHFAVTPWRVRSPSTDNSPCVTMLMPLDLKFRFGNCSTSRKSAIFRWASRELKGSRPEV